MKGAVYVNGTITPADQAVVPVYDHGFVYGEGVYETLRTYNRIPFLYERHTRRLRASAAALNLAVPFDDDSLRGWIDDTMAVASRLPDPRQQVSNEAYIRILLTRGVGELSYDIDATSASSLRSSSSSRSTNLRRESSKKASQSHSSRSCAIIRDQ